MTPKLYQFIKGGGMKDKSKKIGKKIGKAKPKIIIIGDMVVRCAHTDIVDISTLVPHPDNPNKHPKEQIALLAEIMKYQGVRNPIGVSNRSGFMTKGHGRLEAAKILGWKKFPIDRQDYDSEAQEYADLVADNKIQELSFHDNNKLKELVMKMPEGFDLKLVGMTELALDTLLKGWDADKDKMDGIDPDGSPMTPKVVIKCKLDDLDPIRAFVTQKLTEAGYEVRVE